MGFYGSQLREAEVKFALHLLVRISNYTGGHVARNDKRFGFLPNWRIFSYIILIFNLIMLVWVIGGAASASGAPTDCVTLDEGACNAARDIGTGIGVALLIGLWVAGDFILGILWLVTNRTKSRDCPACGRDVKKGRFVCRNCQHDFRASLPGGHEMPLPR
jgi:hypothetical protein